MLAADKSPATAHHFGWCGYGHVARRAIVSAKPMLMQLQG
jgi:hypothetical protein